MHIFILICLLKLDALSCKGWVDLLSAPGSFFHLIHFFVQYRNIGCKYSLKKYVWSIFLPITIYSTLWTLLQWNSVSSHLVNNLGHMIKSILKHGTQLPTLNQSQWQPGFFMYFAFRMDSYDVKGKLGQMALCF